MNIISLLQFFGITPERYPSMVIAILVIAGVIYLRISLGKPLSRVKDNLLVIITHLSSSTKGKLNTNLIKQMSPYKIQEGGYDVLRESNFIKIFEKYKPDFFDCVDSQKPTTKLDVENHSILCYSLMLDKDFMKPIKTYLYEHPDNRDVFPILAGVYIRDIYLKEHPEITQ